MMGRVRRGAAQIGGEIMLGENAGQFDDAVLFQIWGGPVVTRQTRNLGLASRSLSWRHYSWHVDGLTTRGAGGQCPLSILCQ